MQPDPLFHIFGQVRMNSPPRKALKRDLRPRDHLHPAEIRRLLAHCKKASPRDYCLILLMYRHGLRVSEACNLKWGHISFEDGSIQVNRVKNGVSNTHPLRKDEISALRSLYRKKESNYIFISSRGTALSCRRVSSIIQQHCKDIGMDFPINSHALRHSCGHHMAEAMIPTETIKNWLGHRAIQNTIVYTQASSAQFSKIGDW